MRYRTLQYKPFMNFLLLLICGMLAACGGSSGSGKREKTRVIGALSQAACEQAIMRDTATCFVVAGARPKMYGVISSSSLNMFNTLIHLARRAEWRQDLVCIHGWERMIMAQSKGLQIECIS